MFLGSRRFAPVGVFTGLALILLAAALFALLQGPVPISATEAIAAVLPQSSVEYGQARSIILEIRLPRLLLALLVGAVLAACGAAMQGLFRNPLADPSLIGVTGGASFGAACVIAMAGSGLPLLADTGLAIVALGAAVGGCVAVILVYRLATGEQGTSVATMLLAGIAISAVAASMTSLISYFSDNETLRRISVWQMGNFEGASWTRVLVMAPPAVLIATFVPAKAVHLNALLLGESEARHLGIDVERLKRVIVFMVAVGVGTAVAVAGVIAFVGLVVPHVLRMVLGPDHRALIPASLLGGAVLLVAADTAARLAISPAELPTGIVTSLLGAPVFFSLLIRERRGLPA